MSSSAALMEHVEPTNSGRNLLGSKDPPQGDMGPYGISEPALTDMNAGKDMTAFGEHGGVEGLAKKLCTDLNAGLSTSVGPESERSVEAHRLHFGPNTYPVTPPRAFLAILFEALKDPILILLMVAALISTVLGSAMPEQRHKQEWIDGVAIWIAVGIVSCVGAMNDYQKDKQFRKLNDERDVFMIKTVRNGAESLVVNTDLVVGDIVVLDAGDKVVADGICIQVFGLIVDEASLTGESEPIHKTLLEDPWVRSGTQVSEGSGRILVTAVGIRSDWGKVLMLMEESEDENTPLQDKLEVVAGIIGKIGVGVAIACFVALFVKWLIINKGFNKDQINEGGPIEFFMFAITIIVVAVPEGLPLAVTISLAYSMKKMMADNNFVRVLAACETMGGATAICSDKTGTLTQNRMTVTQGWFSGRMMSQCPEASDLKPELLEELKMNIAMNAKAFLIPGTKGGPTEFVGSRTECALLVLLQSWGINYDDVRTEYKDRLFKMFGFSSDKKMSSCLIKYDDKIRLYNKGAAEWVLQRCHHMLNEYGDIVPLDEADIANLNTTVTDMAKCGLRCIALAYTDYPLEDPLRPDDFFDFSDNVDQNLILSCVVGIKDPLRPEVIDAVATCQRAGIVVRMVTGDNIHTARHIAAECGILFDDNMAMEGPVFRSMTANDLLPLLPKLRVLARSSPKDKLTLVQLLKQQGEVVAVTGDGTNDAPALKESDVGLAMGIAGTEVAKEAADIIIMDDNFSSIVKSVLWGRSVFNNIRKFLQFQLTVNVVALVISFIGAVVGGDEPLNILQLLWVNLIMDTMGALALATELPHQDLLLEMPNGREEALITLRMWKHIIVQSVYQLFWLFLFIFALPQVGWTRYTKISDVDYYSAHCVSYSTGIFNINTTYAMQLCNGVEQCGFPLGGNQQSDACWLYRDIWRNRASPVPSNMRVAYCGANSTDFGAPACKTFTDAAAVKNMIADSQQNQNDEAKKNYLSVLFNTFIFMQLFNEICARRINDEYTIFEGLHKSPIFIAVIAISVSIQIIIVELLGSFFKVTPQNGVEWIVAIAIGAGAVPTSLLTRFVTRLVNRNKVKPLADYKGPRQPITSELNGGGGGSGVHDRQNSRQSSEQHLTSVEKF